MKNREFIEAIRTTGTEDGIVWIVNPGTDGEEAGSWAVGKVTFLMGVTPEDTIIEASPTGPTIRIPELLTALAEFAPDGDVQVYVPGWEGQQFAYFDVKDVSGDLDINLGDWRCGG